jgi:hypothetical protein
VRIGCRVADAGKRGFPGFCGGSFANFPHIVHGECAKVRLGASEVFEFAGFFDAVKELARGEALLAYRMLPRV